MILRDGHLVGDSDFRDWNLRDKSELNDFHFIDSGSPLSSDSHPVFALFYYELVSGEIEIIEAGPNSQSYSFNLNLQSPSSIFLQEEMQMTQTRPRTIPVTSLRKYSLNAQ